MRKKKDNSELEPKKKKSRAKYKCPDALGRFIGWDNAIPPNTELVGDWREKFNEYYEKHKRNIASSDARALACYRDTFDECLRHFSEEAKALLKEYYFSEFVQPEFPEQNKEQLEIKILATVLDSWYPYYCQRRKDLRDIAKFFLHLRNKDCLAATDEEIKTKNGETIRLPVFKIFLSREGTTGKAITPEYQAYIGADLDRIRACEICERIFWANYKNSYTCSQTCLNALRQRRHRKTNKEAINEKRRANYDRNKKLKEIKEKKNGNL